MLALRVRMRVLNLPPAIGISAIVLPSRLVARTARASGSNVIRCALFHPSYLPITSMGTVMVRGGMQEFRSQA